MKKMYIIPRMKTVAIAKVQMLTTSDSVKGPNGTGYGGVDTGGTKDPSSRRYNGWDDDEDEEDI